MSNICDFDRIFDKTAELKIQMTLKEMRQARICGEQDF